MYEEVSGGIKVLSAVANVNKAIPGPEEDLLSALNHTDVHLVAVEPENISSYKRDLSAALQGKQTVNYVTRAEDYHRHL